jgi:hypothetical protein
VSEPTEHSPEASDVAEETAQRRFASKRTCGVCGIALSAYNEGPNCWRHSVGMPWRGPSAKPKIE